MLCRNRSYCTVHKFIHRGLTVTFAFWLGLSADMEMAACPGWAREFKKEMLADSLCDEWLTAVLRAEKVRLRVISSVSILITWHFIAVIKQTFILFDIDLQTKQMGRPRHKSCRHAERSGTAWVAPCPVFGQHRLKKNTHPSRYC